MTPANALEIATNNVVVKAQENEERDYSYLHPSELGGCPRQTYYKSQEIPQTVPFSPKQLRVFNNGHFLHMRYQCQLRDSGILARDKVAKTDAVTVKLGLKDIDRIAVKGKTGRTYHYSPEEWVWLVEDPPEPLPDIGGIAAPYQVKACDLEPGQDFWMVEVPVIDEDYHIGGHADAIINTKAGAAVVDFKSSNAYSFAYLFHNDERTGEYAERYIDKHFRSCHICGTRISRWKDMSEHLMSEHRDHICVDPKHRIQLTVYMWMLDLPGGVMLYENKNNQMMFCQDVPRDEVLIAEIQANARDLWDDIENGKVPARPYKSRSKFPCGWCDWASHCWAKD